MATALNADEDKKVIFVNNQEDYNKVLDGAANKVVLVEFYAQWCGPCKLIGTKLEELANLYNDKAIIVRIDVDNYEEIAIEHNVTSMPTFIFMKNKKKLHQFAGSNSDKVEETLSKFCGEKKDGRWLPPSVATPATAPSPAATPLPAAVPLPPAAAAPPAPPPILGRQLEKASTKKK